MLALEAEIDGLKARMRQQAKKGNATEGMEAQVADKLQASERERPAERRYWVTDSTPEKLGDLLKDNPNGLLVSYDEVAGWLGEMERQGREGSRAFYLAAWEGTGDYYVDRIGRGSSYLPAICLSVMGGIQPNRLRRYLRKRWREDRAVMGYCNDSK